MSQPRKVSFLANEFVFLLGEALALLPAAAHPRAANRVWEVMGALYDYLSSEGDEWHISPRGDGDENTLPGLALALADAVCRAMRKDAGRAEINDVYRTMMRLRLEALEDLQEEAHDADA